MKKLKSKESPMADKNKNFLKKAKVVDPTYPRKYENLYILSHYSRAGVNFYVVYNQDTGDQEAYRENQIAITGDVMIKTKTEIYPWEAYPIDERIDKNYFDSIEDYEAMPETKEELVLALLRTHTALLRAEDIMKRSLGEVVTPSQEEEEFSSAFMENVDLDIAFAKHVKEVDRKTASKSTQKVPVSSGLGFREMIKDYYTNSPYTFTTADGTKVEVVDFNQPVQAVPETLEEDTTE